MRKTASRVFAFLRPLASVALLGLAPKCLLCLAAYAGLGALLGIRSREICGATGNGSTAEMALGGIGIALGVVGLVASLRKRPRPGGRPKARETDRPAARSGPAGC